MPCPFAFDDVDTENEDVENRENSDPNRSNVDDTIRKCDRGLRGKAYRFHGKVAGCTFTSDSSHHDRIDEFNTKLGDRLLATKERHPSLKWISYLVLSSEIGQSSSADTCDIHVISYLQSTEHIYAKSHQTWTRDELEWKSVPGGSSDFTREILNSGEERAKFTVYGNLGLNQYEKKEVILFCFLLLSSTI
jgi:hypothetical protein